MASSITNTSNSAQAPVFSRLGSILNQGICNALALKNSSQDHQVGYDDNVNTIVYFNCLNNANKLKNLVFDPADGVYHISLEYADDASLIEQISDKEKVQEIFNQKMQALPPLPEAMKQMYENGIQQSAIVEALKQNDSLLTTLCQRSHKVAVLILDGIEMTTNENTALRISDGFFFFERKKIEPKNIKYVLISEQWQNAPEIEAIKAQNLAIGFEFVSSNVQNDIPYSYKSKQGNFSQIVQLSLSFGAPDFLSKINEIYHSHFNAFNKPMFTHAIRL